MASPIVGYYRRVIAFAHFQFDPRTRELFKRGRRVRLGEKPARVLEALLSRPGDLITRRELRELLWDRETFVDFENNLNSAVATLRHALGDAAATPKYIETLPRLGYRFIGSIDAVAKDAIVEPASVHRPPPAARTRHIWLAGVMAVALALSSGVTTRFRASGEPAAVLDARYLIARGGPDDIARAIRILEAHGDLRALPPAVAEALAEAWWVRTHGGVDREMAFDRAERAARRTLDAGRTSSAAWRILASIKLHRDGDAESAARFAGRAIQAAPRDPHARMTSAAADLVRGRHDAALAAAREAIRLDPASWRVRADLAFFLLAAGRDQEALVESRATLALDPASRFARDTQLTAAVAIGAWEEARDAALALMTIAGAGATDLEAVKNASPIDGVAHYRRWQVATADRLAEARQWPPMTAAAIYASAGDATRAVEWLRRARVARDPMLVFLPAFRDFDPIRADPAFRSFVASPG